MRNPGIALVTCLVLGVLSVVSCSDDIQDTGTPFSEDASTASAPVTGTVLWEKPLEAGVGPFPVADEGRAYLSLCRSGKVEIEAWSLADGERLWRTPLPHSCSSHRINIPVQTLRGTGENLLIHFYYPRPPRRDAVVALNKADGSIRWELKGRIIYLDRTFPFLHLFENLVDMVVGPEMAYISRDSSVIALDHKTGERKWHLSSGHHWGFWGQEGLVGNRLYLHRRPGRLPGRVLDARTGKELSPPPLPEFVRSLLNRQDSSWVSSPVIGQDRLFLRIQGEERLQLVGYDLVSGERTWTIEGDAFYPGFANGGKLYASYRPTGVWRGWSPFREKLWNASIDERTGHIDWQVPDEGKMVETKGHHLLVVGSVRGAQVLRVEDGSPVWISMDYESVDTLDSGGTRLLHIANGKASLISLE